MDHDDIVEAIRAKKKPAVPQEEPLDFEDSLLDDGLLDDAQPEPENEAERLKRRLREILG